jgi:hypothetical protein
MRHDVGTYRQTLRQVLDAMHRKCTPSFGSPLHYAFSDMKPANVGFDADWKPVLLDVDSIKHQDHV